MKRFASFSTGKSLFSTQNSSGKVPRKFEVKKCYMTIVYDTLISTNVQAFSLNVSAKLIFIYPNASRDKHHEED